MAREFFKDLPDTTTPLTATRLNGLLDGEEVIGNIVVDSIRTKNMFGNYKIINGWLDNGIIQISFDKGERLAFISCKKNTTYTISRSVATSRFRIGGYANDIPTMTFTETNYLVESYIKDDNAMSLTYTTGANTKYLIIEYCNNSIDSLDTILNSIATIQLEEGSTVTTFTKFQNLDPNTFDTGWVDMSSYLNSSNFAIRSGYTPMVRRVGKQVFWRGSIYCNNTLSDMQGQLLTNLPQQFSPSIEEIAGSGTHYELNIPYKIWIENNTIKVNEGSNIPATHNYQGYSLSDLGPYLID